MLFRSPGVLQDEAPQLSTATETIVRRSTSGRLFTIELSPIAAHDAPKTYDARVAQMAAMNRPVGTCRGVSREDAIRKACAIIDAAMPSALPKAA
jgi:hypothetical protein